MKFTWDPKSQEMHGPIQKLGKMDADTGRIISDFFDEQKIKPNEQIKFFVKGFLFLVFAQLIFPMAFLIPLQIMKTLSPHPVVLILSFFMQVLVTFIFMVPLLIGVNHLLQLRRTSYNYSLYKINQMVYRGGLIEQLRYKGIDMQFRVVNSSKFFNITSNVKRIVFFIKPLNREKDAYVMSETRCCMQVFGWLYKQICTAPHLDFRVKKENYFAE